MRVQQDAERELIILLGDALSAPERVRAVLPEGWSPRKGLQVTVQSDGTPITSRGWTRETIRISVHAEQRSQVSKVMRLIDAFLLSPRQGHFLSIQPGAGILVTPDSKVGGHVASATYRVAKPRIILGGEK